MQSSESRKAVFAWQRSIRTSDLESGPRLVALILSTYMDGEGVCWPTHQTIAEGTAMSVGTVRKHLLVLRRAGWLNADYQRHLHGTRVRYRAANPLGESTTSDRGTAPESTSEIPSTASDPPDHCHESTRITASNDGSQEGFIDQSMNTPPRGEPLLPVGFDVFWKRYPNDVGEHPARRAWKAARGCGADEVEILEGLKRWCDYWDERGEPGFIPTASRWLTDRLWSSPTHTIPKKTSKAASADRAAFEVAEAMAGAGMLAPDVEELTA